MVKYFFLIILLLLFSTSIYSNSEQDSSKSGFGAFFHFNLNSHSADFKKLPDCPSCSPGYESGIGTGISLGALYEFHLRNNLFFSGRISYFDYSGTLNKKESTTVMYNQKSTTGEFEHNLDASLVSVGLEPGLKYKLFGDFHLNLFFHAGYVVQSDYSQYEKITKPSDAGTFLDPEGNDTYLRTRNVLFGAINEATSLNITLMPGVSYELPLNRSRSINLGLEIFYSIGITPNVISDEVNEWSANSLRIGASVKYSPVTHKTVFIIDTIRTIDTVFISADIEQIIHFKKGVENTRVHIEKSKNYQFTFVDITRTDTIYTHKKQELKCDIIAVGVKEDGTEIPVPFIRIEEFVSSKLQPLLNYVFFEEASAVLMDKYVKLVKHKTMKFDENKLFHDSVLGVYYQLLNIIGSRMQKYPKANLRIIGCNDGYSSEKNDLGLSQKRAQTVRDYLMTIWNIEPDRLTAVSRNLPEKPSTPIEQYEKIEENRRVELVSDEYEIVKPVFMSDTIRITEIPKIRFKPIAFSTTGINKWSVHIQQMGYTLKVFESKGNIANIDWDFIKEPKTIPRYDYPIIYKLHVEDKDGATASTMEKSIEIDNISVSEKRNEKKSDLVYEKYSLILFDFNKADISRKNSRIVDFIKTRLTNESKVNITGHTDRTGDDSYNQRLSEARALKTLEILGRNDATARGYGEQNLLYNNDIPEGRFYCRTVNIEVETPVR